MGLPGSFIRRSHVLIAGARREGGINGGCAVLHVGVYGRAESLFCTFHKVAATTTVDVEFDATGHDVAAFGIDDFSAYDGAFVVGHFDDFAVFDKHATAFEPTFGREYATIGDLFKHGL